MSKISTLVTFSLLTFLSGCGIFSSPVKVKSLEDNAPLIVKTFPKVRADGIRERITEDGHTLYLSTMVQCPSSATRKVSHRMLFLGFSEVRSLKASELGFFNEDPRIIYITEAKDGDKSLCFISLSEKENQYCQRHRLIWKEINQEACRAGDKDLLSAMKEILPVKQ